MLSQIIAWGWGADVIAERPQVLIQAIIDASKLIFTYPVVIVFIPMIIADIITNEYEKGIMLAFISFPVKRSEILISKFASVYLVSWIVVFFTSLAGILTVYKNHAMLPPIMLIVSFLISTALLCFLVCSVSSLVSAISNHTVVATMGSLTFLLLWPMIINVLSWQLKSPDIMTFSYTGSVPRFIELLTLQWGKSETSVKTIVSIVIQSSMSFIFLFLSYLAFNRKEFK